MQDPEKDGGEQKEEPGRRVYLDDFCTVKPYTGPYYNNNFSILHFSVSLSALSNIIPLPPRSSSANKTYLCTRWDNNNAPMKQAKWSGSTKIVANNQEQQQQ